MVFKVESYRDGVMVCEGMYYASNSCDALKMARIDVPENNDCVLVCDCGGIGIRDYVNGRMSHGENREDIEKDVLAFVTKSNDILIKNARMF